ncbi:hypothetical protein U8V72_15230 [Priestia filamentosa]|uniref:hypothetical protein n=1 Tax=Priestia filamentosa TaxID=1402861 RepID=UPI000A543F5A
MKRLSDILEGLPPVDFSSKKEQLYSSIQKCFPSCKEALEIVKQFKKSRTVTSPMDFPLSKDFLDQIYKVQTKEELLKTLKQRLNEQNEMIQRDVDDVVHLFNNNAAFFLANLSALHKLASNGEIDVDPNEIKEFAQLTQKFRTNITKLSNTK